MDTDARPALARGRLVFIVACSVVGVALPFSEHPEPGAIHEMWPPMTVFFLWTTLFFDTDGWRPRALVAHGAAQVAVFTATATALGTEPVHALGMAEVNVGCAVTAAYLFHRLNRSWDLHSPHSISLVMLTAGLAGLTAALLGGFPGTSPLDLDPRLLLWWVIRNGVFMFVGVSTMLVVFHAERPVWRDRTVRWWEVALLAPFSLACVWLVYEGPQLPITWVLLLPGIAAGLIFDRLGAALAALATALAAAAFTMLPGNRYGYDGWIPASVVVDLLVLVMTFLALQLAVVREQRATIRGELEASRTRTRAQATFLTRVLDSMNDGVIVFGHDGRVAFHNPAARQLLGGPLPVSTTTSWVDHFGIRDADGGRVTDRELVSPIGDVAAARTLLVDNPGSERFIQAGVAALETETGPASLVLFSDVTAQRQRMAELASFARVVAHDLRTPLTSLYGRVELAREDLVDGRLGEVEAHLARALESGDRMRTVIEDWLAYSVHRDGRLVPSAFELAPMVHEVLEGYRDQGGSGGRFQVAVTHKVEGDPALVRQLLTNLVGNAMKYVSADRPPEVRISSRPDEEDGWIRIDVTDRGIGIPKGQEEAIFDEFHRAPDHAEAFHGSGLGLSLCKRIVHRHGGRISAASNRPEPGATFSFTLPGA